MVVVLGFLRAKMKICWMRALVDLAGVVSSGMLRRLTPLGASCLEIAVDGIRSGAHMFFLTVWFQSERCEALLFVTTRWICL